MLKNPAEIRPGMVRFPSGPPTGSVRPFNNVSLRDGTDTVRLWVREVDGCSCMLESLSRSTHATRFVAAPFCCLLRAKVPALQLAVKRNSPRRAARAVRQGFVDKALICPLGTDVGG